MKLKSRIEKWDGKTNFVVSAEGADKELFHQELERFLKKEKIPSREYHVKAVPKKGLTVGFVARIPFKPATIEVESA